MIQGADLDKIFKDDYGDAGFNDPVPDVLEEAVAVTKRPAEASKSLSKPYARPAVLGATPPPPEGVDPAQYEVSMAMDEAARQKGYSNADEYNRYLQESGALKQPDPQELQEETPLAPGIKKAPAYMPPGAYPGDRTKLGKDYDKEHPDTSA